MPKCFIPGRGAIRGRGDVGTSFTLCTGDQFENWLTNRLPQIASTKRKPRDCEAPSRLRSKRSPVRHQEAVSMVPGPDQTQGSKKIDQRDRTNSQSLTSKINVELVI